MTILLFCAIFIAPIPYAVISGKIISISSFGYVFFCLYMLIYLIYLHNNKISFFNNELISNKSTIIVSFSLFFIGSLYSSASRYYSFNVNSYDFGLFYDMINDLSNGGYGYTRVGDLYHFVTHQNYILLFVALIYKIIPNPILFCVLQSALVTLNGVFIYKISNLKLNKTVSLLIALSYLLSSFICFNTNFRPEYFLPTFILFCYYSFINKNYRFFYYPQFYAH